MSEQPLLALAREAGLLVEWTDAAGRSHTVSRETVHAVLSALGYPASSAALVRDSHQRLLIEKRAPRRTIVATPGEPTTLPARSDHAKLTLEHGTETSIRLRRSRDGVVSLTAPQELGYHRLEVEDREHVLAVTPAKVSHSSARKWGLAVQLYALRGGRTKGFGDFSALAELAKTAGQVGADALAISPIHAGLPGAVRSYSPYSPSSRFVLNPLFAAIPSGHDALERRSLIAWRAASQAKLDALDRAYEQFVTNSPARREFEDFVRDGGPRLLSHARFEALHTRFAASGRIDWRSWPIEYRNANSADATRLGRSDPELERHLFRQWLAHRDLAHAQKTARDAGMGIGLIADLAVGIDPRGSHAWSAPQELLNDLSVGAPPDALGPNGQDWGLTTLSPFAMRSDGYRSFIETLRASMRHAGGIRVDHAMGLMRLWVIPSGAPSSQGVYLSYPFEDLLRLLTLEAVRNRSVIIAEDLGTVPAGFRDRIAAAGLFGMRVLLFERNRDGSFVQPTKWHKSACALPTTHDLPTLAGWWRGRDLAWRAKVSDGFDAGAAKRLREEDREQLWQSLIRSRCANGTRPAYNREQAVVDAAIAFVGRSASKLALIPLEDVAGEIEQPNLPGTVDEHPNWRRRLPSRNGLAARRPRERLAAIAKRRSRR